MTPEQWQQIEQLYHAAQSCHPDARAALLQDTDPEIRARVERMLDVESGSGIPGQTIAGVLTEVAEALPAGTELGPYRIEALLGAGGMGTVYRAVDTRLQRVVAIKLATERYSDRFRREAQAISTLNHPHICTLHDAGPDYLVMEFLEGPTLAMEIRKGPLSCEAAAQYGAQIAGALAEAHAGGIVHRDLKPSNIMLTRHGIKVLDFGLAKMLSTSDITGTFAMMGTPAYMAPEQVESERSTPATDLFALGLVLFEMLTGSLPFAGGSLGLMLASGSPPLVPAPSQQRAGIPPALDTLVAKLLAKDPALRPQQASEVSRELSIIAGRSANPPSRYPRRAMYAALLLVLISALTASVYFRTEAHRSQSLTAISPQSFTQLTSFTDSATGPVLSPDGRMLAFYRSNNPFLTPDNIWVKLLPNGESVQVTSDPKPKYNIAFSPDSTRIAYTAMGNFFETYVVSSLGGDSQLLFPNAAGLNWLDNGHLLFSQIRAGVHMGIVTSNADRSGVREIYFPAKERGMAHFSYLSPDGKWVLLAEMDPAWQPCRVVPFSGGMGTQVGPPAMPCVSAAWAPDGKWIYLSAQAAGRFHLWRQRFPDGQPEQITFGSTEEKGIAVAPDGRSLITSIITTQNTVWMHDTSGDRPLSGEGYATGTPGVFSSDGKRFYYLLRRDSPESPAELVRTDVATGKTEVVIPGVSISRFDISGDEKQVIFSTTAPGRPSELWIAPLDRTASPRRISAQGDETPFFGPDHQVIFRYTEGNAYYAGAMNFDGKGRRRAFPMKVLGLDRISPDRRVMLLSTGSNGPSYSDPGVAAVSLVNGRVQTICATYCIVKWSPDGRYLYVEITAASRSDQPGKTVAIRVPRGQSLPPFPAAAVRGLAEWAKVPGVQVIGHADISPGPKPSIYAYIKTSEHANLFRIPIR